MTMMLFIFLMPEVIVPDKLPKHLYKKIFKRVILGHSKEKNFPKIFDLLP